MKTSTADPMPITALAPWFGSKRTLAGKRLACWCAPEPCHGDVIADAVERLTEGDA